MNKENIAFYEKGRDHENKLADVFYTSGCEAHFHHQTEILCVKSGSLKIRINDTEEILSKGDVCISDSYDIHTYSAPGPGDAAFVMIISKAFIPDAAAYSNLELKENFVTGEKAAPIAEIISVLERNIRTAGDLLKRGLCQSVLGAFYDILPASKREEKSRNFHMREVLQYIHANYSDALTLETLSKRFGYNPTHFSRIFNSFIPCGLKEYLNKIRSEQAAILIRNGCAAIRAATDCGFMSIETFYRAFKKNFGMPPKAYFSSPE